MSLQRFVNLGERYYHRYNFGENVRFAATVVGANHPDLIAGIVGQFMGNLGNGERSG